MPLPSRLETLLAYAGAEVVMVSTSTAQQALEDFDQRRDSGATWQYVLIGREGMALVQEVGTKDLRAVFYPMLQCGHAMAEVLGAAYALEALGAGKHTQLFDVLRRNDRLTFMGFGTDFMTHKSDFQLPGISRE